MKNWKVLTEFARVINSDRYQYTESDVFLNQNMQEKIAVFDVFFRKTEDGGFAVVSGISEVIELIEILNNTSAEEKKKYFSEIIEEEELLEYLVNLEFRGDISAMHDGEIAYPFEPIVTIKAPLIEAKILETPILNILNHQMAVATKASRVTRAAKDIPVSSFGSRRAHGFDSAILGSKAAYIGGCSSHSNLVAEYRFGIKSLGTMSHSYIQSFGVGREAEKKAFDAFAKLRKTRKNNSIIFLIDTYNTLEIGIKNAIKVFKENNIDDSYKGIYGIRIDSGDLAYLSKKCRKLLDDAGLSKAKITLTNALDENLIKSLREQEACVDFFGVGDAIAVSKSNPCFGGVYKIAEINSKAVIKLSEDIIKITNPGEKEVYRIYEDNEAKADLIGLVKNDEDIKKLLSCDEITIRDEKNRYKETTFKKGTYSIRKLTKKFVKNGAILTETNQLNDVEYCRNYYLDNLNNLARERKRLTNPHKYKVDLSEDLYKLKYKLINEISSQSK